MVKKSLAETNRYLKDRTKARRFMIRSLASSTAIETGEAVEKIERKLNGNHLSRYPVTLA